ncbi:guanylate kinase [Opitutia bacterium SCGC AG-212-L18]|nr:guanylate kinase [Opitutae bacterium SCGC AG-212-L18]
MIELLQDKALVFIVSGPAGSGKTTLCHRMLADLSPRIQRVVTATTRQSRSGEVHGVDYYFLSKEEFIKSINAGEFYEYAQVHSYYYGILKHEIKAKLKNNIDLLINIDVQGAETLRKITQEDPDLKGRVVSIFIMPPNMKVLNERLKLRGLDVQEEIERRLTVAQGEVQHWPFYDYCIPTGTKEEDFACLLSIYAAEKLRVRS